MNKLFLSPGHYPRSPGAEYYGLVENTEAQEVIDALIPILNTKYEIFTGFGTINNKIKQAKEFNPELAIDVHFNACGSGKASGTEVLINPNCSNPKIREFADSITNSISTLLEIPNRGTKEGYYRDTGKLLGFLKGLPEVGLILEILFMDNKKESQYLLNKEYIKIASSIALGIQRVV